MFAKSAEESVGVAEGRSLGSRMQRIRKWSDSEWQRSWTCLELTPGVERAKLFFYTGHRP